ncbi:MAG: SGNH/GDSL hydrolase family protein [Candidatus Hydrogenedentes bacterium]|nr:SGNH/GDSL hydrolase family protein [Candidatus Hydrogenedentota bacterium]
MARNIRRRILEAAIIVFITGVLLVLGAEVLLRLFFPQVVMFPRWEASPAYGVALPRGATMVHARPGKWEFRYSINEDGCRGARLPAASDKSKPLIVTLGDSYTMGMGVNDGEEYPAILARALGNNFRVMNCGSPGWGLTQEVRRFHEFALHHEPDVVILQFCANDPEDGQRDAVTRFVNDGFVFQDTARRYNPVFAALSNYRFVQSSQLYAFIRGWYEIRRDAQVAHADTTNTVEQEYVSLLGAFARDLDRRKIPLIMISVNGQLDNFPVIRAGIETLDQNGLLEYIEVKDWFRGKANFESPEGHEWGAEAHAIIGRELARYVKQL